MVKEEFGDTLAEGLEFKKIYGLNKKEKFMVIDRWRWRWRWRERNKNMCKFNEEREKENEGI